MSADAPGPLLLIDGHSLAYRAFFALPETISTSDGTPTNALYGLAAMMMKLLPELRPRRVVVAWDPGGKVFRHETFPEYKAGRSTTPDLFREQSAHFRPLMEAFGFVNTELPGFEADDVIGTLARRAEAAGEDVVILTGDRDALQLVTERVSVMATGRGVTDTTLYTPAAVVERYGVTPEQMTDFRGLVGDTSDNLPGVPGVGEKGAAQLIARYGSLVGVLDHAAEQSPKRRENLENHREDALISRDLSVIETSAPTEFDLAAVPELEFDDARLATLAEILRRFEFTSLVRRLDDLAGEAAAVASAPASATRTARVEEIAAAELALRLAGVERVALAMSDGAWAVAADDDSVLLGRDDPGAADAVGACLDGRQVICHDAKSLPGPLLDRIRVVHDTMIAAYLLDPRRRGYGLAEVAEHAGIAVQGVEQPAAIGAAVAWDLAARQGPELAEGDLGRLFSEIELPLVPVLAAMERVGIQLDVHRLGEIAARVRDRADELRDRIWELAGGEFTIESPKQLGQVLFERLGLPTFRRGKTGYSTDRQVLRQLRDRHPIIDLISDYRELTKLDNTYLSALPELVDAEDRLHTTFNQTVAETGRLSSTNPNLQNIPVRTPLGREVRGAFVAREGWSLVSCDYSQVELRILAHCSGEPTLADAFRRGDDVHRATAAEVFGMAPEDVDRTTRDRAKAVNFGIVYGISDFGLSEQLGIPRADARAYIDTYLARYPRVKNFIDTTIAAAGSDGYVTTLLGRRRAIPELAGRTLQQRQLGERLAVNTIIQGSAADIIKLAMVRAHAALAEAGLAARLVLQIHDELLIEAPADEVQAAASAVRRAMVGAYDLDPPLGVDTGVGATWLEAKS